MTGWRRALALLAGLVALGQGAGAEQIPPPPAWHSAPEGCTWVWQQGGGIALWTESCRLGTGHWHLRWSATDQAFLWMVDDQVYLRALRPFAHDGSPALADLRARLVAEGALPADSPCHFRPVALRGLHPGQQTYQLLPDPPAAPTGTEVPAPPCGGYGASSHGLRYVLTDAALPGLAVFIDEGQERPMFAPDTLRAAAP